jgi:hypothetical protein
VQIFISIKDEYINLKKVPWNLLHFTQAFTLFQNKTGAGQEKKDACKPGFLTKSGFFLHWS